VSGAVREGRRRDRLSPFGPRPDPTPSEGPDPYGNPEPEWLAIDWRARLRSIDVAGPDGSARVNYVELGPAEPEPPALLLVHGLSGCWQNWLENIPHLSRRRRVIALDLPGFGSSPMPEWEVSITAYARLLHDFCTALEVRECAVVGSSMGGFVAADASLHEPGRFEQLALVSAAGVSSTRLRREPTEAVARMLAAAAPWTFRLQTEAFRRPGARRMAFRNVFRHPELLRPELLWEFFAGAMRGEAFTQAFAALAGYHILDRLEEVEVPALIVWGRNDNVVPPADALEFGRMLSHSETAIFDDTGHVPMAERPVRFNRLLEAFVSR
jgi:pimeloyl-ACP methyl ester carboxylesterase